MGLPAYVPNFEVETSLEEYGEVTDEIIKLKYKKDHPLAGLENGNRLVRMYLNKPSIRGSPGKRYHRRNRRARKRK